MIERYTLCLFLLFHLTMFSDQFADQSWVGFFILPADGLLLHDADPFEEGNSPTQQDKLPCVGKGWTVFSKGEREALSL